MSQPALTIASLLCDPRLLLACGQWLKGGRYELEDLGAQADPLGALERRRDALDVVLLQQGAFSRDQFDGLIGGVEHTRIETLQRVNVLLALLRHVRLPLWL